MTTEDTRTNEQADLARKLGIETCSATYIARTLDLASEDEFAAQAEVLAAAYGLGAGDIEQISTVFGQRSTAAAAA